MYKETCKQFYSFTSQYPKIGTTRDYNKHASFLKKAKKSVAVGLSGINENLFLECLHSTDISKSVKIWDSMSATTARDVSDHGTHVRRISLKSNGKIRTYLNAAFLKNPHPHKEEFKKFAEECGLSYQKVNRWFINQRKRTIRIMKMTYSIPDNAIIIYIKVSKWHDGRSGSGIFIDIHGLKDISFSINNTRYINNYSAELIAIEKSLKYLLDHHTTDIHGCPIWILTGSKSAETNFSQNYFTFNRMVLNIRNLLTEFYEVKIKWRPSNMGRPGNDIADLLANMGAMLNNDNDFIKNNVLSYVNYFIKKWQQRIEHKASTDLAGTCVSMSRNRSKDKCCLVLQFEMKRGEIEGTKGEVCVLNEGFNRAVNNNTAETVTRDRDTTKPKDLLLDLTNIYDLVGKLMSKAELISYSEEENQHEKEKSIIQTITTMLNDFDDLRRSTNIL